MTATARAGRAVHYPESDDMGEHETQRFITELLRPLVAQWLAAQGRTAHAGADQFFYWIEGDPRAGRAPDVYVVDGVAQDVPDVATWKVWQGHRPHFALEVCGLHWQKDYDEAPADYAAMGARELVIFDPCATPRSRRCVHWQLFRAPQGGRLQLVLATDEDRVYSEALGCWLRMVHDRGRVRLRLATGEGGETLVPTEVEHALARAAQERAEAEHALAEVARLQNELAALRRRP